MGGTLPVPAGPCAEGWAVGNDLGGVLFDCVRIRESTRHPVALAAVARIEAAVGKARATLARPAGG